MRKIVFYLLLACVTLPTVAGPRVAATYPWIAQLTQQIGGNRVTVSTLAPGNWDPHFVIPKPSLIAAVRKADLLIINGAQLEIGWLPPLIQQSGNPDVQPGRSGLLDISRSIHLLDTPASVSRSDGDVHPEGNPHYILDPANILKAAAAIASRLAELDTSGAETYRQNFAQLEKTWTKRMDQWDRKLANSRGMTVVQYHKLFNYFLERYGIQSIGELEPLPGIPPTSRHIGQLAREMKKQHVRLILIGAYNPPKSARFLEKKTGAPVLVLPHDIFSTSEVTSLPALYEKLAEGLAL